MGCGNSVEEEYAPPVLGPFDKRLKQAISVSGDKIGYAIQQRWDDVAAKLLDDIDKAHVQQLFEAAQAGLIETVKKMVEVKGLDPASQTTVMLRSNKTGQESVIYKAAMGSYPECADVVEYLVNKGVNLHVHWSWTGNDGGWSAIVTAARCGHPATVRKLVALGANINDKSEYGYSVLRCALERAKKSVEDYEWRKSMNQKPKTSDYPGGVTPSAQWDICYWLVENGAQLGQQELQFASGDKYEKLQAAKRVYEAKPPDQKARPPVAEGIIKSGDKGGAVTLQNGQAIMYNAALAQGRCGLINRVHPTGLMYCHLCQNSVELSPEVKARLAQTN